jgi:hypothetical protein
MTYEDVTRSLFPHRRGRIKRSGAIGSVDFHVIEGEICGEE